MKAIKPIVLVILDGFGFLNNKSHNAIAQANKPTFDFLWENYPHSLAQASGKAVGLLDNYNGNSQVGHITIGSGRVIPQTITIMAEAIANKTFYKNTVLCQSLEALKKRGTPLHIMGLLSDGHVHSDLPDLYAFLDAAHQHHIKHVFIHPFLDGRDSPIKSASRYLQQLDDALTNLEYGSIGSIHGRFYAMDRDKHWDRTEKSYRALTDPDLDCVPEHWETVLQQQYKNGLTDEFIIPTRLDPTSIIEPDDGIIFINVRPDRARQLTATFVDPSFNKFPTIPMHLACFITPTEYSSTLKTDALYPLPTISNTLKTVLDRAGKTIFSIAETEKYAHVTYFFDGYEECPRAHETRILIPSLPTHDYINNPNMSANTITETVLQSLSTDPKDFYLINYANADMVGHSGNFAATIKAVECLDEQLKKLYDLVVQHLDGTLIITADHGKAEEMIDETGQIKTAHTANLVPFMVINQHHKNSTEKLSVSELQDIAPYILSMMGIEVPPEMKR